MRSYLLDCSVCSQAEGRQQLLSKMAEKCDDSRLEKAGRIRTEEGKFVSLAAGMLLQKIRWDVAHGKSMEGTWTGTVENLLEELDAPCQIGYRIGEHGKPYFAKLPICFSLSHSGEFVFAVADHGEVGVDIQKKNPDTIWRVAGRFFAQKEVAYSACLAEPERMTYLYRLWTMKEAYGKLTGRGVAACLGTLVEELGEVCFYTVQAPEGYEISICKYISGDEKRKENE
ncbi:MAG: 4'-phosphopantetheinyl transferase family protein [Acetatifactor sp.]